MDESAVYTLLLVPLILCFTDWRLGVLISVAIGFAQDPIRKAVVGEPLYLSLAVGAFLAATCLGAYRQGIKLTFGPIHGWYRALQPPLNFFIAVVLAQSLATYLRFSSPILAAIGLVAYMAPLPAILIGYHFSQKRSDVIHLITVYVAMSAAVTTGVYFSYLGFDWAILKQVGSGLIAYGGEEGILVLHAGFMRSPEIAAWHAGTSACLVAVLLLTSRKGRKFIALGGALMLFFTVAVLFTGRRKYLMEIMLFVASYCGLLALFHRGGAKSVVTLVIVVVVWLVVFNSFGLGGSDVFGTTYFERGISIREDSGLRMWDSTIGSFQYVLATNGIAGMGAGTGSQGSQYFGGGEGGGELVGFAAEGGLAKVLAELGLPGFFVLLWLALRLISYVRKALVQAHTGSEVGAKLTYGVSAVLIANSLVFTVGHQVFGDPFVLIMLGFLLGSLLATPQMLEDREGT